MELTQSSPRTYETSDGKWLVDYVANGFFRVLEWRNVTGEASHVEGWFALNRDEMAPFMELVSIRDAAKFIAAKYE